MYMIAIHHLVGHSTSTPTRHRLRFAQMPFFVRLQLLSNSQSPCNTPILQHKNNISTEQSQHIGIEIIVFPNFGQFRRYPFLSSTLRERSRNRTRKHVADLQLCRETAKPSGFTQFNYVDGRDDLSAVIIEL